MRTFILILLTTGLVLYSCNKVFHNEDIGYILLDNQQKKIDLLNGMYSRLVAVHSGGYFLTLIRSDDINYYNDLHTVNFSTSSDLTIDFQLVTNRIYNNLYSLIITANTLLPKLSESEDDKKIRGEVYFLRAYAYFKLARLFGNPQLVKDADVSFTMRIPSYVQVYEFIEQDLLKALELLPDNPPVRCSLLRSVGRSFHFDRLFRKHLLP